MLPCSNVLKMDKNLVYSILCTMGGLLQLFTKILTHENYPLNSIFNVAKDLHIL